MSIPALQNTNLNNKISELQIEYAYLTFYDTFVHANKLEIITFAVELAVFLLLTMFGKSQLFVCSLAAVFMAITQLIITHLTLIPLLAIFHKQLLSTDQITWAAQFRQEECVRVIVQYNVHEQT